MILRALGAGLVVAALGGAPLQCGGGGDPDLRRQDDAGDALWGLAQELKAKGNVEGAREALRYLVEKYPSNRHVPAAREELGETK